MVDRGMSLVLFILYSMPSFFVGTLLLLQFANPDNLSWFPVSGIQDPTLFDPNWSLWMKLKHRTPYLILPIITYTYDDGYWEKTTNKPKRSLENIYLPKKDKQSILFKIAEQNITDIEHNENSFKRYNFLLKLFDKADIINQIN